MKVKLMNQFGELTQDSKQMPRILNTNFAVIFTNENTKTIPKSAPLSRGLKPLEIDVIQEQDVKGYMDRLKTNKSTGFDALSPRLRKVLKQQILQPLTSIYNLSVQLNKVPGDGKLANILPIQKMISQVALKYQPVSLIHRHNPGENF